MTSGRIASVPHRVRLHSIWGLAQLPTQGSQVPLTPTIHTYAAFYFSQGCLSFFSFRFWGIYLMTRDRRQGRHGFLVSTEKPPSCLAPGLLSTQPGASLVPVSKTCQDQTFCSSSHLHDTAKGPPA